MAWCRAQLWRVYLAPDQLVRRAGGPRNNSRRHHLMATGKQCLRARAPPCRRRARARPGRPATGPAAASHRLYWVGCARTCAWARARPVGGDAHWKGRRLAGQPGRACACARAPAARSLRFTCRARAQSDVTAQPGPSQPRRGPAWLAAAEITLAGRALPRSRATWPARHRPAAPSAAPPPPPQTHRRHPFHRATQLASHHHRCYCTFPPGYVISTPLPTPCFAPAAPGLITNSVAILQKPSKTARLLLDISHAAACRAGATLVCPK